MFGFTCFRCWSRLDAWFVFTWVRCAPLVLCYGFHVVSTRCSGKLCWLRRCCVTSRGKLYWRLFDAGSSMLRLWHGFGLLQMVGFKWESSGPASRSALRALEGAVASSGAQESYKRCSSHVQESPERARAHSRVVLNCPFLDIPQRRLVQSERRYGAEPRPCPGFLGWNLRDPTFHSFRGRYKLTDFICPFSHTWC